MTFAKPLLLLGCLAAACSAWALPTDRDQPIHVQADSAELDDRQGKAIYRGDVVITQGTLKITGNTVTVTRNARGEIDTFTAQGRPAYYEQQPEVGESLVHAYGRTIEYFASNERIVLTDQAKVVRDGNTFEGERIVYDTRTQVVNAGRAQDGNVTTPRPRIDMVIQPRKKPAESSE
ncbi:MULTISPECIES: lipopolysaccharide transport periplasmic protein LptA [Pseudomonas]|uniref:Lipopolysaccharide export system protein LptA n=1 Tax=Pseudomonas flexibilis TaxID=706570 RepID=A0A0B3C0U6_9PSED|nr:MULTISPECIES: lipopolysaccharide transport periplasmic protein LptA [Pseudomonas]KHL69618.1 organic solvent tolerance protein OstA [Pseudomonas flexibilis]KHO65162.1 organic solvent tolerance protein OstA [Pseudomonas flexibilis]SCY42127.1 lipopolysaccharide export system protein LptA [Pseudomonas flexibilis]SIQ44497.1 lipopolysaccharide export system protein LptA [Pseudomonas flexibilis]